MLEKNISIDLKEGDYAWCHIEDDDTNTLIGMYENGKVERQLFYISRERLRQLIPVLEMLADKKPYVKEKQ